MNQREEPNQALSAPDQDLFANAGTLYWQKLVRSPEKLFTQQVEFWAGSLQNFIDSQQASVLTSDQSEPQSEETDPRFSYPMWQNNPYFNAIKRQYAMHWPKSQI